jgi:hypothetical protein
LTNFHAVPDADQAVGPFNDDIFWQDASNAHLNLYPAAPLQDDLLLGSRKGTMAGLGGVGGGGTVQKDLFLGNRGHRPRPSANLAVERDFFLKCRNWHDLRTAKSTANWW